MINGGKRHDSYHDVKNSVTTKETTTKKHHTQSQVIVARFFELSLSLICHILLIRLFSIVVN